MNQSDRSRVSGRLLMRLRGWELTASRSILPPLRTRITLHGWCKYARPDLISDLLGWYRPLNHQIQIHPVSDLPFSLILRTLGVPNHLIISLLRCSMGKSARIKLILAMLKLTYIHMQIAPTTNYACLDLIHTEPGNDNNGLVLAWIIP